MTVILLMIALSVRPAAWQPVAQDSNNSVDASSRWLLSFKHSSTAYENSSNPRLLALLRQGLPHYAVSWFRARGKNFILPDAAAQAVSIPGSESVESDRFVTITGVMPGAATFKGLLWCDTGAKNLTMLFVFMEQHQGRGKDDSGSLDIYTDSKDTLSPLPPEFVASVLAWEKDTKVTKITSITIHDAEDRRATIPVSVLSVE